MFTMWRFFSSAEESPYLLIDKNELTALKQRLESGQLRANHYEGTSETLLGYAFIHQKPEAIALLLQLGADPNYARSGAGFQFTMADSLFDYNQFYSPALVRLLLTYGLDFSRQLERYKFENSKKIDEIKTFKEENCDEIHLLIRESELLFLELLKHLEKNEFNSFKEVYKRAKAKFFRAANLLEAFAREDQAKLADKDYKTHPAYINLYQYRATYCRNKLYDNQLIQTIIRKIIEGHQEALDLFIDNYGINYQERTYRQGLLHLLLRNIVGVLPNFQYNDVALEKASLMRMKIQSNMVRILLVKGIDINLQNANGVIAIDDMVEWLPVSLNVREKSQNMLQATNIIAQVLGWFKYHFGMKINLEVLKEKGYPEIVALLNQAGTPIFKRVGKVIVNRWEMKSSSETDPLLNKQKIPFFEEVEQVFVNTVHKGLSENNGIPLEIVPWPTSLEDDKERAAFTLTNS